MMLLTPVIYLVALKFGKWELFLLAFFGITICGNLSVDSTPLKGWIVGFLGFFFAMIGRDAIYNSPRFVILKDLNSGITLVPALIGLFGIAEVLCVLMDKTPYKIQDTMGSIIPDKTEMKSLLRPVIRSGLIGCGIGAIPGAGEDIAAWLSYSVWRSRSKEKDKFMHGSFEGLSCSETANNACIAGAMIPMLTLAIPGSSQAAMFLAAMNLHGVKPGPMLSIQDPTFMYLVGIFLIIAAFTMVVLALVLTKPMVMILKINRKILMPIIVPLTMIGAYATNGKVFDVWVALFFGVIGFILRKCNFSMAPLVLGLILGGSADTNFRQAMTQGNFGALIIRPAGIVLLIVCVYSLVSGAIKTVKSAKTAMAANTEAKEEAAE